MEAIRERLAQRNPHEPEFMQAVDELLESVSDVVSKEDKYLPVLERMLEPERVIMFRVPWVDDQGNQQINRGFRVQFNSALGPYKGGLRFHPSVNLSILKFLGFEQIFKNAGVPGIMLGGGKGGADFNPRGRSDAEVMRFCQSFMSELFRHIGAYTDVPAGDIGVGAREIGYLFGQYKRLANQFTGVLTGKGSSWGGSLIRPEATGYGVVYFLDAYLRHLDHSIEGKRVAVSGSGNVAQHTVAKLLALGAVPVSMSDSSGCIYEPDGISKELLDKIMQLKNEKRGRLSELDNGSNYHAGKKPWKIAKCDIAIPCATQNEVEAEDAEALKESGVLGLLEGANMPCTAEAVHVLQKAGLMFGPAKAVNAGGVAVSGLEMAQDAAFTNWTAEEVDGKLKHIMKDIFENCVATAEKVGKPGDLLVGANCAGFLMVADAMLAEGLV